MLIQHLKRTKLVNPLWGLWLNCAPKTQLKVAPPFHPSGKSKRGCTWMRGNEASAGEARIKKRERPKHHPVRWFCCRAWQFISALANKPRSTHKPHSRCNESLLSSAWKMRLQVGGEFAYAWRAGTYAWMRPICYFFPSYALFTCAGASHAKCLLGSHIHSAALSRTPTRSLLMESFVLGTWCRIFS